MTSERPPVYVCRDCHRTDRRRVKVDRLGGEKVGWLVETARGDWPRHTCPSCRGLRNV